MQPTHITGDVLVDIIRAMRYIFALHVDGSQIQGIHIIAILHILPVD